MTLPTLFIVLAALPSLEAAPTGQSGASRTLALTDVLLAVDAHPLVDAARADLEAANAERFAAEGGFDPVLKARGGFIPISGYPSTRFDVVVEQPTPLYGLNLFSGYRLGLGSFPEYYGERATNSLGEIRAGVDLPLLRNGWNDRRRTSIAKAEQGQVAANAAAATQRLELLRLGSIRYWEWVAAGQRREIARALLAIAKDRDVQIAARVKAGDLPSVEREDNQRAVVQREAMLVSAQRALEQASIELSLYLRDDAGRPTLPNEAWLPSRLPDPDSTSTRYEQATLDEAIARRPDIARLHALKQQAQTELTLARNQVLPALDVGAVFRKDFGAGDPKLAVPELEVSVLLDVPLPNRTNRGRRDVAAAQLSRIDAQLRFAHDRVKAELTDSLSALRASSQRVVAARAELAVARTLETKERERFGLGDSTLLFVNLREQQSAEAALREIDALVDYQRAVASWRAAVVDFKLDDSAAR